MSQTRPWRDRFSLGKQGSAWRAKAILRYNLFQTWVIAAFLTMAAILSLSPLSEGAAVVTNVSLLARLLSMRRIRRLAAERKAACAARSEDVCNLFQTWVIAAFLTVAAILSPSPLSEGAAVLTNVSLLGWLLSMRRIRRLAAERKAACAAPSEEV